MNFNGNISFNAQHPPMGAFMSFTCGHHGTRGGIGTQIGKPANQDLYIGIKDGDRFSDAPLKCLPFFKSTRGADAGAGAADFQVEQAGPAEQSAAAKVIAYKTDEIRRSYGWATDAFETDDFRFTIYTPFGAIPDPDLATPAELAEVLRPAVIAELEVDNTDGASPKTAFFAINFNEPGWRPMSLPKLGTRRGFTLRDEIGILAEIVDQFDATPMLFCRWTPDEGLRQHTPHLLGSCPGVSMTVEPGERATLRISIGCHLDGVVTTGLEGRYFYNRLFTSIDQVLGSALDKGDPKPACAVIDQTLADSTLSPDQQFLIAHATRSYYGSTQLLDVGGQPFWIVNEGEYCMMNTLDLTVDQVFWELKHNPWVVRNQLDNFVRHYSYVDEIKTSDVARGTPLRRAEDRAPGGLSFCHDMGAHNNFSPAGTSSYELPDLTGCFSYMTAEQLCNWILTAACYVGKTSDEKWLKQNASVIRACLDSLNARCGDLGYVQFDSSCCGESGAEITTYDSLDHSLAQARNNVYMAVKCWASYHVLSMLLGGAGLEDAATNAYDAAMRGAANVAAAIEGDVYPAVFEPGNPGHASRILPAIEGLIYVHVLAGTDLDGGGTREVTWNECGPMLDALKRHTLSLLKDSKKRNFFADGGIKLSSTSNNSWMSKIALFQHVCREVYELDEDPEIRVAFERADAAHVKWQTDGSGYWACSDQFVSGIAKGSRYYPRIITTALWLEGRRMNASRDAAVVAESDGAAAIRKLSATGDR
jgi:xylan 1,4-beta-xylosidase